MFPSVNQCLGELIMCTLAYDDSPGVGVFVICICEGCLEKTPLPLFFFRTETTVWSE